MDLVKLIREELACLNISDKVKIKDLIYYKTGELFNYDPLWKFSNDQEKAELKQKNIDIHNVTDFNITCFSWAPMFKALLKEFDINAEVIKNDKHACVVVFIDGKKYLCDLMTGYEDIKRIKFGMDICYNYQISNEKFEKNKSITPKKSKTEEMLEKYKTWLQFQKLNSNYEEYVYKVYKIIEEIMNRYSKPNVGYVSGIKFICHLLDLFIDKNYYRYNTHFFNKETGTYIEVYAIPRNGGICYFVYKENEEGCYKLHEAPFEEINEYCNNYSSMRSYNLILSKESNTYSQKKKDFNNEFII